MSLKAKVMLLAFALAFILQQIQGYDVLMVVGGMYVNQSVAYTVKAVEVIGLTSVCQVHLFAMYYCPVRDIKNRILQFSKSPNLKYKVLQNAYKIKKRGLTYSLK